MVRTEWQIGGGCRTSSERSWRETRAGRKKLTAVVVVGREGATRKGTGMRTSRERGNKRAKVTRSISKRGGDTSSSSSTAMRQLKHHEQRLLKKVDFLNVRIVVVVVVRLTAAQWKQDAGLREIKVLRRYHIQDREDYHKSVAVSVSSSSQLTAFFRYNKLCGSLRAFAHRVSLLPAQDPFRTRMEGQLLSKLYDMGVLNSTAKLSDVDNKLTVAAFCRRRLAVFMCMSKMAETVSAVRRPRLHICWSVHVGCLAGRQVHRARTCPCRTRHHHRPCIPGNAVRPLISTSLR